MKMRPLFAISAGAIRIAACSAALLTSTLLPLAADAQEKDPMPSQDPIAYFLGISVGQSMQKQGIQADDFDKQVFLAGLKDGLLAVEPKMSAAELEETQGKVQAMVNERMEAMVKKQLEDEKQWFVDNGKKDGIKTLESGVQYKVLKVGEGPKPGPTDTVRVHYTGKLLNGTVFDSSVQRGEPAEFPLNRVIRGWQVGLSEMTVGAKWMLYIPSPLGYGPRGTPDGNIGPNSTLIFEVELLAIK
ncbi:MAG: FKBP-type peptidyl-prolyl cis-trans isomerase [Planctomycetota bacterium]